ncbi:MAG TPA: hypothetical protein VFL93_09895, partial [Longimicrobiaceae bacterium]|nr:hypothetical protein [Longimicrobiaceae bacterium]
MDLVDRLHDRLRAAAPAPTGFTIGELYQRLIPYRSVRGELGVWELAEYEHALLRLLSGERDYLELEDPSARAEIARELASPNPILGVYRDYPAARVRLGAASTG